MVKKLFQEQLGKIAGNQAFDAHGRPKPAVERTVLKALEIQRPLVLKNLRRLQRKHPQWTPQDIANRLGRDYITSVTGAGAAVGATAIVPGIGTAAALGLSAGITLGFLEATALYVQSIAELHGLDTADQELSRTIIMAVVLGDEGKSLLTQLAAQTAARNPGPALYYLPFMSQKAFTGVLADQLKKMFFRKVLIRQGTNLVGRAIPFGIGAVLGGAGNNMLARKNIQATLDLFGPFPELVPGQIVNGTKELPEKLPPRELSAPPEPPQQSH